MLIDLVLQLGLPRVVQTFIDSATAGGELRTLLWIGVVYLVVLLLTRQDRITETRRVFAEE